MPLKRHVRKLFFIIIIIPPNRRGRFNYSNLFFNKKKLNNITTSQNSWIKQILIRGKLFDIKRV